jgi:hypothetical protein
MKTTHTKNLIAAALVGTEAALLRQELAVAGLRESQMMRIHQRIDTISKGDTSAKGRGRARRPSD